MLKSRRSRSLNSMEKVNNQIKTTITKKMKKVFKVLKFHNTFSIFIVAALFTACTNNETTETTSEARTQVSGFTISTS